MDDQLATELATALVGQTSTPTTGPAYRADPAAATATFTVKEKLNLLTATGAIPVVGAEVSIDADGLPRGRATLDVSRIDTGNARRDKDLKGARFFDCSTFPLLDFRSISTRRDGDTIVVDGLLTVRGEECPLRLVAATDRRTDGSVAVHATGTFDRMTSPLRRTPRWIIAPTVDFVVDATLLPVRP